jgi:hypothetical protein
MLYVIGTLSRDIEALFLIVDTVEAREVVSHPERSKTIHQSIVNHPTINFLSFLTARKIFQKSTSIHHLQTNITIICVPWFLPLTARIFVSSKIHDLVS